ncbi:DUF4139 domain-containing protein [Alcaligenes faecalis]|uniref:DUF4139 domain-containing protein n=1 Tax=Alcaligenes faecalis TaxID=511 RepID=UPI001C83DA9D|nr:DUF4139 domain-containing protein [Alcaligenes faecalis]MBX6963602.1 DUF4139 domain-containing protein [Providencia rettgeri]MBX7030252.1 DUF4139 domain-containing protein [Alcaligenes faecalis]
MNHFVPHAARTPRLRSLTGALLLVWMGSAASTAWAQQIESITLSSAGMAEIERQIPISDTGTAQLRVPLTQVDDILKTLMAVDGKNRIDSLTLSGLAPLKESFDSLPFSANDLHSPATLAQALRGQQVSASSQGRLVRGAVLGVQATAATNERPAQAILSVLTEQGQIQTLELGPDTSLEVLDKTLQQQLQQATEVLAGQSNQQSRDIQLVLNKTDAKTARLSYLIPAPVWKSSYRLMMQDGKARLQAWAIFENTSGEDWKDVKVTLSSGSPVMLRQRLLERYWNERPELPVAVGSSIAPQADTQATLSANQARKAAGEAMRARMAPVAPAPMMEASYMADSAVSKQWASGGAGASTQAQEGQTQVRFSLPQTLSVPTGQTVSVPFIDTSLQAEALSVYRSGQAGNHPTAAIWVNNEQANSLPPGIITVFNQADGHVGDAELAGLPAGEQRLIYFAQDSKVQIREEQTDEYRLSKTRVTDGVARSEWTRFQNFRYEIKAPADEDRTVLIQLPRQDGWTFKSDAHDSDTAQEHRLKVKVAKGKTVTVTAQLSLQDQVELRLEEIDENMLLQWRGNGEDSAQQAKMDKLIELRRQLSQAQQAQNQAVESLNDTVAEQERIRANLAAVSAQSTLGQRFSEQLAQQEDQIASQRKAVQEQRDAVQKARQAFEKGLAELA